MGTPKRRTQTLDTC